MGDCFEDSLKNGTCASGGPLGVPGNQAGRRPIVTQTRRGLGGEKCPRGFPTTGMCGPAALAPRGPCGATWETAPTGVERELKSSGGILPHEAGAEVVGGPARRVWRDGILRAPRGGVQHGAHTICGGRCARIRASHRPLGTLYRSERLCDGGKKKVSKHFIPRKINQPTYTN